MGGTPLLVLGPVLYGWPLRRLRDFYFKIADEAAVDVVLLGEVICTKRTSCSTATWLEIRERLERGGKTVAMSTLALPTERRELESLRALCREWPGLIEANDYATLHLLAGRPHLVGAFINVYHEATLAVLLEEGAVRVCLPPELSLDSVRLLARSAPGRVEVQVFGRLPLALSARCHHARSLGRTRARCRFACRDDPDGLALFTLDGRPFLTINGIQTLSASYLEASFQVTELLASGVGALRILPQDVDMVAVVAAYRALLDGRIGPEEVRAILTRLCPGRTLTGGYLAGRPDPAPAPAAAKG